MFSTFLSTKSKKFPIYLPYNAWKSCFSLLLCTLFHRYLASNDIEDMTNVSTLPSLRLLDLGYNSIRHITGVQHLSHLEKLFLGRNKIETISVVLTQNAFIAGIGRTSPPHPRSAEQSNSILPWTRHSHRPPRTVLFGWDWRADISRIMEFQKSRGWKR